MRRSEQRLRRDTEPADDGSAVERRDDVDCGVADVEDGEDEGLVGGGHRLREERGEARLCDPAEDGGDGEVQPTAARNRG